MRVLTCEKRKTAVDPHLQKTQSNNTALRLVHLPHRNLCMTIEPHAAVRFALTRSTVKGAEQSHDNRHRDQHDVTTHMVTW